MSSYEQENFEQDHSLVQKLVPIVGLVLILTLVGAGGYWLFGSIGAEGPPPPPAIQEISLVKPPLPPKEEELPEPEPPPPQQEQEVMEIAEPPPLPEALPDIPDAPPPGPDLGVDAAGGAGSDAFGLVGRKGGQGLVGGTGGGDAHLWYAGQIRRLVQDLLNERQEVRRAKYTVVVRVWIEGDGRIRQADLVGTTGDPAVDRALRLALTTGGRLSQPPPADMPQPVRLRISSRL